MFIDTLLHSAGKLDASENACQAFPPLRRAWLVVGARAIVLSLSRQPIL
jgi:hypothetical protein